MATEIERKFLASGDSWKHQGKSLNVVQGYFPTDGFSLRVRIQEETAFLTLKKDKSGIARHEFEYAIPPEEAEKIMELFCTGATIRKTRHLIDYKGHTWEVDEFHDENSGLVVAEVELESESQQFEKPPWAGMEVTGDPKYLNASLARHPFSKW